MTHPTPALPWVRDFTFVGGVTGFLAPFMVIHDLGYCVTTGLGGAATGALLGLFTARLLAGPARKWSKLVFLPAGIALGSLWGIGAALGTVLTGARHLLLLSVIFAGAAGAVQLGWFWLAYSYRRVNLRSTLPVVLLAAVLGAFLGGSGFAVLAILRAL